MDLMRQSKGKIPCLQASRLLGCIVIALTLLSASALWAPVLAQEEESLVGVVIDGALVRLSDERRYGYHPRPSPIRATSTPKDSRLNPETGELDLSLLEGRAIVVRGHAEPPDGWIYSAAVAEIAPLSLSKWLLSLEITHEFIENLHVVFVNRGQLEMPDGAVVELTTTARESALAPETGRLDLSLHEGKLIVVHGYAGPDDGWIYSASVEEIAPPLLTEWLLLKVRPLIDHCPPPVPRPWPAGPLSISEIEMNPLGEDAGNEWVELCNHSSEAVSLADWEISYTSGCPVPCTCWERLPDVTVAPRECFVYTFGGEQLVDSGLELCLKGDGARAVIQASPALEDTADDNRTWQRFGYEMIRARGGDFEEWYFKCTTKGEPN